VESPKVMAESHSVGIRQRLARNAARQTGKIERPRPVQSIGPGVFELKDSDESAWYRMVYLARVKDVIYVLDCFEKDTAKTERKDINTAKNRLSAVKQRVAEERRNEKRKPKQ